MLNVPPRSTKSKNKGLLSACGSGTLMEPLCVEQTAAPQRRGCVLPSPLQCGVAVGRAGPAASVCLASGHRSSQRKSYLRQPGAKLVT